MFDPAVFRPLTGLPVSIDGRVLVIGVLFLPFIATYLITKTTQLYRLSHNGKDVEPPPATYWIPFVGNTISFAFDTRRYLTKISERFSTHPVMLWVGMERMYLVPHGEQLTALFRVSRELTAKVITLRALRDSFGCPLPDLEVYQADESGFNAKPLPGFEDMVPRSRIFYIQHRDLYQLFQGTALNLMTQRFIALFIQRIEAMDGIGSEWTEIPDLYDFLRMEMFRCAMTALYGEAVFKVAPDIAAHFWAFDAAIGTLFKRIPRIFAPRAYAARDALFNDIRAWHAYARANFDWNDKEAIEADWEPLYGARLMRARQVMWDGVGLSADGRAANDLALSWATNANAIPATFWMLLDILRTPGLRERVMAEMAPCIVRLSPSSDSSAPRQTFTLDIAKLLSGPLQTSIYMEELRLRAALTVARMPLAKSPEIVSAKGFRFGRWLIPVNATIIASTWLGGHDKDFWNEGRRVQRPGTRRVEVEHPTDEFWAERFLEYPDDVMSGPVRKEVEAKVAAAGGEKAVPARPRTIEDDKTAKVVTSGHQGHWYPYGGGTKICPGRFFAKQEMMTAVAVMLNCLEIELLDQAGADAAKVDMAYFPFGVMPPDRKIPVRMRKRRM